MKCNARDTFQCSSTECVLWTYVCDGIVHCSNKADEECDMCNNDLYTCRDSSRINCTLACNTLGYIPCRNYMDKKVCTNVLKRAHKVYNSNNYQFITSSSSGHQINIFGSSFTIDDTILFLVLGVIILCSLFLTLVILSIRLKHRIKRKISLRSSNGSNLNDENIQNVENNQNDDSFHEHHQIELERDQNEKCFDRFKSESKYKRITRLPSDYKSNNELNLTSHIEFDISAHTDKNNTIKRKANDSDYQLYGDPPPSYDQSKYFPQSTISNLNVNNLDEVHIYENIDESSSNSINSTTQITKSQQSSSNSSRKNRFYNLSNTITS